MKKLKDTKIGLLLKEKAPKILDLIGDVLPSTGTMGILKNIISKDPDLTPEEKKELHNRVIELYKLEVADRDSARSREVEISKVRKFDFMFNLTGLVGLGTFVFLVSCLFSLPLPSLPSPPFSPLLFLCEGIVLSIFGFYFGSIAKK